MPAANAVARPRVCIAWMDLEGRVGAGVQTPPGKSQVAIGFLRTTGTDPP